MTTQALKGGPELLAFLGAFPAKLQKGAVRAGVTAAAKPIRDKARANVRKRSGKTAKAIKTSSSRVNQDGTISVKIQLKGEHSFIGLFLEYGVAPHLITPGDSDLTVKALNKRAKKGGIRKRDNGLVEVGGYTARTYTNKAGEETGAMVIDRKFIRGAVLHPGFTPKPFLRPALDTEADEAINEFGKRIRSYLSAKSGFTAPLIETADE